MQKWKVVRSVIDWTIALYLVIPFSIMVPFSIGTGGMKRDPTGLPAFRYGSFFPYWAS
ncbi:hypothetical protein ACPJHQ_13120 [Rossellomorea sp. H39__3]